jgi:hypothetical protein
LVAFAFAVFDGLGLCFAWLLFVIGILVPVLVFGFVLLSLLA